MNRYNPTDRGIPTVLGSVRGFKPKGEGMAINFHIRLGGVPASDASPMHLLSHAVEVTCLS